MLVLSRRPTEKVVFPNLGISVQVIRVAGRMVRLGIEAPPDIRILREEIFQSEAASESELESESESAAVIPMLSSSMRHAIRNRLHNASLGLQILHRRLEMGSTENMESTIFQVFNELKEIDSLLQPVAERRWSAPRDEMPRDEMPRDEMPREEMPQEEMKIVSREELPRSAGRRALIVDDNANESELLATILRMSGFEVATVDDGLKAMAYLRQNECPDAVLLDMCMPRLDGPKTICSMSSPR